MSPRDQLRQALKDFPDGATNADLAKATGLAHSQVSKSMKAIPEAYIDRWIPSSAPEGYSPIWVLIPIPENCPKPTAKYHAKDLATNLRVASPPSACRFD